MNERAVRFGDEGRLVGILTEPQGERESGERPTVILLNSGILHRVGAGRLYVKLARALAGKGFAAFRFDFSGIGDSEVRRDGTSFRVSSVMEARTAMDFLAKARGARSFVLGGLCSGADVAFWAAREDERVVGLIQMDGFAYPTARYYLNRISTRVARPSTWPGWVAARTRSLLGRIRPPAPEREGRSPTSSGYQRTFPPRTDTANGLRELTDRGVAFYHFFSGSHRPYLNYAEQYADSFPDVDFRDRLHVDYLPEADHTVTNLEHQGFLVERVLGWTRAHWPTGSSPPVEAVEVHAGDRDALSTGAAP